MIRGVKFATIPVRDQDKALKFYTEALGCVIATDQPFNDKQRWIELRFPGSPTRLVLFTFDGYEDRIGTLSNIAFWSDDVESTYNDLVGKGVEFTQPPKKADWGTSAIFKDPDGNMFVLSSR
jgi:catechol 2,3-dioxygenase-like lactoylglutathione lyase family enzyme